MLALRPRRYARTPQQFKVAEAAKACGIHKGMSRAELIQAMTQCIPTLFETEVERGDTTNTDR